MTTPRIRLRRLVFLLLLPGCHTWRPVALAPNSGYQQDGKVRVEREHTTNSVVTAGDGSTGVSSARAVFHGAWVDGDTLFGWQSDRSKRHAVAIEVILLSKVLLQDVEEGVVEGNVVTQFRLAPTIGRVEVLEHSVAMLQILVLLGERIVKMQRIDAVGGLGE